MKRLPSPCRNALDPSALARTGQPATLAAGPGLLDVPGRGLDGPHKGCPSREEGCCPRLFCQGALALSFLTVCLSFMLELHQLLLHDILGAGTDHLALKDCRLGGPRDKHKAPFLLSSLF